MRDDETVLLKKLHIRNGRDTFLITEEELPLFPKDATQASFGRDLLDQLYLHLLQALVSAAAFEAKASFKRPPKPCTAMRCM